MNIVNLTSVLTIRWCVCIELSLVCYDQYVLLTKLCYPLPCFIFYSKILLFQVSFNNLLLHSNPLWWKGCIFWVSVLEGLVGLHRTVQLQLFSITGRGIVWITVILRDNSIIFEITSKYCFLDSFVDYDGYSISSKGFLPTVVDIMVIWVKFTHSSPF